MPVLQEMASFDPSLYHRNRRYGRTSLHSSKDLLLQNDPLEMFKDEDEGKRPMQYKTWTPLMLRRWVLVCFIFVFLSILTGLEVVTKVCKDKHGFGPTESRLRYIWTYGPTAVFTVIAAFWTQVDYRSRQMQPWEELATRPQAASKTLLLDYISPNPIVSLWSACKSRHWPVAAALLGSALIKVLIVTSTGLFLPQLSSRPLPHTMAALDQFQISGSNLSRVDDVASMLYTAVLLNQSAYPPGTNSHFVIESFKSSSQSTANPYHLTADVKTFTTDLTCENATLDSEAKIYCPPWSGCTNVYTSLSAGNEDCRISDFPKNSSRFLTPGGRGSWHGDAFPVACDGANGDPSRERVVVTSFYKDNGTSIMNSTTFFCKPSFRIEKSRVTIDESGSILQVHDSVLLETIDSITTKQLSDAVLQTISMMDTGSGNALAADVGINVARFGFGSFIQLVLLSQSATGIESVWNNELLIRGSQDVFRNVAAQIGKRNLLRQSTDNPPRGFDGVIEYMHQRLFVRNVSLRLMEASLSILILTSVFLAIRLSHYNTPNDPASIARFSSIVSKSKDLLGQISFRDSNHSFDLKSLTPGNYMASLDPVRNNPDRNPRFTIKSQSGTIRPTTTTVTGYWQPTMTRRHSRLLLLLIPLGVVIVLEVLLRKSLGNEGLLYVELNRNTQLGSVYVPAILMVIMKLLYSWFDFDLQIMDPFVQLKNGSAKARSSILSRTIYTWKTDAFWSAFMNGRVAVGASIFGVIVASFLTIVASELYRAVPVGRSSTVHLNRIDRFYDPSNMTSSLSGTYGYGSIIATRMVVYEEMTSVNWTYGPYVFPHLSWPSEALQISNATSDLDVRLPIQRGVLFCDLVPTTQVVQDYERSINSTFNRVDVAWNLPGSSNCTSSGDSRYDESWLHESILEVNDGPFAYWDDYSASPFASDTCPKVWGMYGSWEGSRAKELNIFHCWSSIQESEARVSFSLPDWKIKQLAVEEATTRNISNAKDTLLSISSILPDAALPESNIQSGFTVFLRNSDKTNTTMTTELLRRENFETLYARIQDVYSIMAAQVMNIDGRYTNLTTVNETLEATATSYATLRLQQSLVSTRILQGLLITMIVCSLVSLLTIDLRKVLPVNPCTIAAQASLVAASTIVARLPSEAQWMDDKEFDELFEGARFSMGWSGEEEGEGWFGIDVDERPRNRVSRKWFLF